MAVSFKNSISYGLAAAGSVAIVGMTPLGARIFQVMSPYLPGPFASYPVTSAAVSAGFVAAAVAYASSTDRPATAAPKQGDSSNTSRSENTEPTTGSPPTPPKGKTVYRTPTHPTGPNGTYSLECYEAFCSAYHDEISQIVEKQILSVIEEIPEDKRDQIDVESLKETFMQPLYLELLLVRAHPNQGEELSLKAFDAISDILRQEIQSGTLYPVEISPGLFVGGEVAAANKRWLEKKGINCIYSLDPDYDAYKRGSRNRWLPDLSSYSASFFENEQAIEYARRHKDLDYVEPFLIDEDLKAKKRVFVQQTMNDDRSIRYILSYLARCLMVDPDINASDSTSRKWPGQKKEGILLKQALELYAQKLTVSEDFWDLEDDVSLLINSRNGYLSRHTGPYMKELIASLDQLVPPHPRGPDEPPTEYSEAKYTLPQGIKDLFIHVDGEYRILNPAGRRDLLVSEGGGPQKLRSAEFIEEIRKFLQSHLPKTLTEPVETDNPWKSKLYRCMYIPKPREYWYRNSYLARMRQQQRSSSSSLI